VTGTAGGILLLITAAVAHDAVIHKVELGDDWCRVANEVAGPGDIVELAPGRWPGGCVLLRGGIPEKNESTLIRSAEADEPAVIEAVGADAVVTVAASHIRLYNLAFDGLDRVAPLLAVEAPNLTVDRCTFTGPATGVLASESLASLILLNNTFDAAQGWRLGCADGSCAVASGVIRNNLVRGASVEMTLTPAVLVFDNVVAPTEGPAYVIRGGATLRRNLAFGGGYSLTGGPWELDSSLAWGAEVALDAADATGLVVRSATLDGDVFATDDAVFEAVAYTGAWSAPAGVDVVDCAAVDCFLEPRLPDARPVDGGPLATTAVGADEDFCEGNARSIGALTVAAAVPKWLAAEPKSVLCDPESVPPELPLPEDTGAPAHTGDTGGTPAPGDTGLPSTGTPGSDGTPGSTDTHLADDDGPSHRTGGPGPGAGCGCAHSGPGGGWLLLTALLGLRRGRSSR
jgi:hypothetical protein